MSKLTLSFVILFALSTSAFAGSTNRGPCYQEAQKVAKTLSEIAFGKDYLAPVLKHLGEDETDSYKITIRSKPFIWGDGQSRSMEVMYSLILDNDSDVKCSLIESKHIYE